MQHINPRQPGFQRPAPQPVDLRNYDGFQWESRRASQHPALPPKPPRPQRVQPYVPSQPGYQGEALKLKEKICLGTVLSWNFRGSLGGSARAGHPERREGRLLRQQGHRRRRPAHPKLQRAVRVDGRAPYHQQGLCARLGLPGALQPSGRLPSTQRRTRWAVGGTATAPRKRATTSDGSAVLGARVGA